MMKMKLYYIPSDKSIRILATYTISNLLTFGQTSSQSYSSSGSQYICIRGLHTKCAIGIDDWQIILQLRQCDQWYLRNSNEKRRNMDNCKRRFRFWGRTLCYNPRSLYLCYDVLCLFKPFVLIIMIKIEIVAMFECMINSCPLKKTSLSTAVN